MEAFKKTEFIVSFYKTIEEKIKTRDINSINKFLSETYNNISNYEMFNDKTYLEIFVHHLKELLEKYEKEKNENKLDEEIFNELKDELEKLINKCNNKLRELESQNNN